MLTKIDITVAYFY